MANVDRQRGCFLGLAIGDALGAAVEFEPPGTFEPVTDFRAGGPHRLQPGEWTDDTSMALALADSIGQVGWNLNDQAQRYVNWYRNADTQVMVVSSISGSQPNMLSTNLSPGGRLGGPGRRRSRPPATDPS